MATDDANIAEDTEMAECDGDKVVTMMDVLQEQQEFEEDANAVLGASDDKNCTYSKGYIKRQALYACLTCCAEAKVDPTKRAGVCLACSLTCHENHELIELYTKRNFRCDCGNPKFNSHPCQFTPEKTELNDDNIYNQNFSGLYCTCQRPYPDPESTIEDDMIQCIICEDWLHASHLEAVVPANDQYSEMICKKCMEKNEFLHDYSMFAVTVEAGDVDILTVNGVTKSVDNGLPNGDSEEEKLANGNKEIKTEIETASATDNGDVEMDENKEKSGEEATENMDKKKDEDTAAVTNEETKQGDLSQVESTELNHEEKPDNETNKIDLDIESQIAEKEQESEGIPETNIPVKTDLPTESEDLNNDEKQKETSEETTETSNDKSDAAENTSVADPEQNKETTPEKAESTDNKPEIPNSTDDKMESTDNVPEKADTTIKEQNDEQISKHSISDEIRDGDNVQENKTDASETEQQLLDDLSVLTADNPASAEKTDANPEENVETGTDEKSVESMEQSEDSIEKKDVQTNNEELPEETLSASGDQSHEENIETGTDKKSVESMEQAEDSIEKKDIQTNNEELPEETTSAGDQSDEQAVVDDKTATSNIEVPDTSQSEKDAKENAEEKTDSVMDAIDELLRTDNEAKETETNEPTSESTDNKEKTDSVQTKESDDVEMSANEKKHDKEVPEKTEEYIKPNDKPSTNDNEDIEMSDSSSIENKPASQSKIDEPVTDSENKDVNDTESTKINEDKIENELVSNEKPAVTDTVNENISQENITLNVTDNELKNSNKNDSTNKTEHSKDANEVPNATENGKEHKRKLNPDSADDISSKKAKLECVRPKGVKRVHKGATFWPSNFRQKLCTCGECLSMYKDLKVLFLTDLEDTVFAYESLGKENVAGGASQYEKGMQALSSLDRIQQINALTEYNKMRDKLLDFLKSFKERREIVKEEDIRAFFAEMKPRREPDGVYFCR